MNLKQLEAFVHVAEGGSFSKAARELYLTQPTISAHIAALEKELNTRLFVRNTKEVCLSEGGRTLYDYAKQMVMLEKRIGRTFHAEAEKGESCITIAASTIPSQYLLPEILGAFSEKYPKEQFKIMEADSGKVVEQVVNHSVDIGFTGTMLDKKHCKYIPFYRDELIIITPNNEKYREKQKENCLADWICEEAFIMREEGSGTRKETERQLKKNGFVVEDLTVVASIDNPETIKKSVGSGMGISVVSKLAAKEEIESGKLLSFMLPVRDSGRDLNLVFNRNFQLSRSAERFIRVVKELYGLNGKH